MIKYGYYAKLMLASLKNVPYVVCLMPQNTGDVKFAVGGKFIYAHKAVLKLSSKYFKGMFDNNWKESTADG